MPTAQAAQSNRPRRSVKQFATEWGVSCMTVYRLIAQGRLEATKVGNQWRIPADAVLK